jgi:hypothetical protein
MRAVPRSLSTCLWVGKAEHCQGACHTGGNTPPADTDVAVPALQRQMHEGGGRERPLVGSCAQHAAKVQVPSGLGHCETPGPWTDAGTAPTSSPEMCVSAHSVMPRTRTSGLGHCDPSTGLVPRGRQVEGTVGVRRNTAAGTSEPEQKDHTRSNDNPLIDGRGNREVLARVIGRRSAYCDSGTVMLVWKRDASWFHSWSLNHS